MVCGVGVCCACVTGEDKISQSWTVFLGSVRESETRPQEKL